jgi:hypothetical protein
MVADHSNPGHPTRGTEEPVERLASMNALLAEWTACSATQSEPLIDRLEGMGYEVRGKTRDEVTEVLKHPSTQPSKR